MKIVWSRLGWVSAAVATMVASTAIALAQEVRQSVQEVTPIFHQLVLLSMPSQFDLKTPGQSNATSYLRETVLRGETVERWTQMITLTGYKGLALKPGATPERFGQSIAAGFQKNCPGTFATKALGAVTVSGREGYLGLAGCGSVADEHGEGATHNETALILVVAGDEDFYTVQWAERTAVVPGPALLDAAKWELRYQQLQPIRVCARLAGEAAPYPSCLK